MTRAEKYSATSRMHQRRLLMRGALLLAALVVYVKNGKGSDGTLAGIFGGVPWLLPLIWVFFMVEMIRRMFPSDIESMGCEKQFAKNYRPAGNPDYRAGLPSRKGTLISAASWIALNGFIFLLFAKDIIDEGILLLIALFYSISDVICILFFCPFQTWMMKNRCCATCRIYNWDFPMMMTPFIMVPGFFAKSLLFTSLAVLAQWEYKYHCHPEYFSTSSNEGLACRNCREKLCHHKKQLRGFFEKNGFQNTG